MTLPHPRAVGSYVDEWSALFRRVTRRAPRWWQQLAAARILEHDEAGELVWAEYLGTISRQGGKSWALRVLALWRVLLCAERWGDQLVIHTGKDVAILREVLKPAQAWGEVNGLFVSRNNLEPGLSTSPHMDGSRWIIRAKDAVYGYAATNALGDEVWAVPPSTFDEGVDPTTVEQTSPQVGLWSTAHRRATGLFRERRASALVGMLNPAPRGTSLLLEWSTPPELDRGDVRGWRMASPHWSDARERLIARAYLKVQRGVSIDPEEPDPIASFDAQWLNRWPASPLDAEAKDEPLVDAEAWAACLDDAAVPDPDAPVFLALEDDGWRVAAGAASLTRDGRVVVGGYTFGDRRSAVDWCQDIGERALDPLLLVGASLVDDAELEGVEVPIEGSGGHETRTALPLVRELVRLGTIAHDGGSDTATAFLGARVKPGVAGAVMLLTGTESTALLRCLSWAIQRAHRERA
jgi:hypothetical protein